MVQNPKRPIFQRFPDLAKELPHLSIGDLPTPVKRLTGLSAKIGRDDLFIKCDDLTARPYGGNKVRKLEFLLADARKKGAVRVITSGAAGSNHALATALYSSGCGLRATLLLADQPASPSVRENLLMDASSGAEMIYQEGYDSYAETVSNLVRNYKETENSEPYVIPPGGSSPVGALGYVNAGLELKEQIDAGVVPGPGSVYIAMGTMGTAAGLLLGLRAAGMDTRLVASQMTPGFMANREKFTTLCREIQELLRKLDPSVPDLSAVTDDFTISSDYYEPGYGLATEEVKNAVELIAETDHIHLDTTYTGKAFAAFLADAKKVIPGPLLFWNTKNSHKFPFEMLQKGRESMPPEFEKYFEDNS